MLFCDKHLRPVIALCHIAHADMGIIRIQNICPMPGGIHPAVDYCLGRCVAPCDIFTGAAEADAKRQIQRAMKERY